MDFLTPEILGWIFSGVIGLFVLFGLLWGLGRGLFKTSLRLGWLFVCALALVFLTPVIVNGLFNVNLSFLKISLPNFLNGEAGSIPLTSVNDFVNTMLQEGGQIGEVFLDNPVLLSLIFALPAMLLNAFLFVIFFWVVKIILYPVWAIIAGNVFKKYKKVSKEERAEKGWKKRREKNKRYRFFGMLVGIVCGLFVGVLTFYPVLGYVNMVNMLEVKTKNEKGKGLVSQAAGEDVAKMVNFYEGSAAMYIMRYTGLEWLNGVAFDYLTSANIADTRVYLRGDVEKGLDAAAAGLKIMEHDFNNIVNIEEKDAIAAEVQADSSITNKEEEITKRINALATEKFDTLLNLGADALDAVLSMGLVTSVLDEVMPYIINKMATDPEFFITLPGMGNKHLDDAVINVLTSLATLDSQDLKNDLLVFIDAVKYINEEGFLAEIYYSSSEITDSMTYLTEESLNEITDILLGRAAAGDQPALPGLQTGITVLPILIDAGINILADFLDVEEFDNQATATVEGLRSTLKGLLNSAVKVVDTIDLDSTYIVSEESFQYVGRMLDTLKGYDGLSTQAYSQLVEAVKNKINTLIDDALGGINSEFEMAPLIDAIKDCVENLSTIASFEQELGKFGETFSNVTDLIDLLGNGDLSLPYETIGSILDILKGTQLFGGDNIPNIVNAVMQVAASALPSEMDEIKDVIEQVGSNAADIASYKDEFIILGEVIDSLFDVINSGGDVITKILEENNSLLQNIGSALDTAKSSTLLGGTVINDLVAATINMLRDGIDLGSEERNQAIDDVFSTIVENVRSSQALWATEFEFIKDVVNLVNANTAGGGLDFTKVGITLDDVTDTDTGSTILTNTVVGDFIKILMDEVVNNVGDGVIVNELDGLYETRQGTENGQSVVEALKNAVDQIIAGNTTYQREFSALEQFMADMEDIVSTPIMSAGNGKLTSLGAQLDAYTLPNSQGTGAGNKPSYMISAVRDIALKYMIGEVIRDQKAQPSPNAQMLNMLFTMYNSIDTIESYATTLGHLQEIIDMKDALMAWMDGADEGADWNEEGLGKLLDDIAKNPALSGAAESALNDYITGSVSDPELAEKLNNIAGNTIGKVQEGDLSFTGDNSAIDQGKELTGYAEKMSNDSLEYNEVEATFGAINDMDIVDDETTVDLTVWYLESQLSGESTPTAEDQEILSFIDEINTNGIQENTFSNMQTMLQQNGKKTQNP